MERSRLLDQQVPDLHPAYVLALKKDLGLESAEQAGLEPMIDREAEHLTPAVERSPARPVRRAVIRAIGREAV